MPDATERLNAALEGRYAIERVATSEIDREDDLWAFLKG
jgi:hypothetical protein